jgi:hypothetical protein
VSRPEEPWPTGVAATRVVGEELRVPYADVLDAAHRLDGAREQALARAGRALAVAGSPHLLASAPFSPSTAAAAEAALTALGTALGAWSAAIAVDTRAVRTAVELLAATDDHVRDGLRAAGAVALERSGRESVDPDVVRTGWQVPLSRTPPADLTGLVAHAAQVSALDDRAPDRRGAVEVQTLTGAAGGRRHVVYLPGLDDPVPVPLDDDVRDAWAAVGLRSGVGTAYGQGVLRAMREAGVRPGEQVLLVGHSLGGMQALALAAGGTPYDITDVVTLGSPQVPGGLPAGVHALSLEHRGDPVPLVDGGETDASPRHVTVRFDGGTAFPSLLANHEMERYCVGAEAVERSADPAVQAAVRRLEPFLARPGDRADGVVLRITREDVAPLSLLSGFAGHRLGQR